jgi:hypothetical protein
MVVVVVRVVVRVPVLVVVSVVMVRRPARAAHARAHD